jgi:CRP-like cAMP-binding protein
MENYIELLCSNQLFAGVDRQDMLPLLECLQAVKKEYRRGEVLFETGENVADLGIVLAGIVRTESSDILGDRSIISCIEPGQIFCDAYSSTSDRMLLVDIVAQTDCAVLLIETERLFHICAVGRKYRDRLSENLIHTLAQKYVDLGCKVIHLSGRSTRRKLLSYFSERYRLSDGKPFAVPFTQQELADYLFIERSGMSTELNKLKKEGILVCEDGLYSLRTP